MIVLHLDSSKSERCAVREISKTVLSKMQKKSSDIANQITLKFLTWK